MNVAERVGALTDSDPRTVGDYRVIGRLSSGGLSVVYLAENRAGRYVAIKLVHAFLLGDDASRRRFRTEVDRARQVPPYCTAEVLDADLDNDPPYLVIEFVDGPSLAEVVSRQGPLNDAHLHSLAIGVATALSAIHGAGVIHRDLKPSNVLLPPGSPKVIDFGIAYAGESSTSPTRADQMVGTAAYMAPERIDPTLGPITAAADIFSWGVIVAYAGTGRTPFNADSPTAILGRILTQEPDLAGLPEPIRGVVERALDKRPDARPTARELLDALLSAGPPDPTAARSRHGVVPPRLPARAGRVRPAHLRRGRPGRNLAIGAAVLLLAGTATAGGIHLIGDRSHAPATAAAPPSLSAPSASPAPIVSSTPTPSLPAAPAPQSPTPSALPSVLPSALPSRPPPLPTGGSILFQDPLSSPGQWLYTNIPTLHASCEFHGTLRATRPSRGVLLCIGPAMDITGDQSFAVDLTVERPGSCAGMWFFWTAAHGGFVLRMCTDSTSVAEDRTGDKRLIAELPAPKIALHKHVQMLLAVRGNVVEVFRDKKYVGSVALPPGDPLRGEDVIGEIADTVTENPPFVATFANVQIRQLAG